MDVSWLCDEPHLRVAPQHTSQTLLLIAVCRKFHRQAEAGYCWQEGDIQWTERNSLVYPAVSSLAGLVAGMFGVGGGIVKVWDTLLLTLNPTRSICHWLFVVDGGIVKVWDTLLLTPTLLNACGWHVRGGRRRRRGMGPFLVHATHLLVIRTHISANFDKDSVM